MDEVGRGEQAIGGYRVLTSWGDDKVYDAGWGSALRGVGRLGGLLETTNFGKAQSLGSEFGEPTVASEIFRGGGVTGFSGVSGGIDRLPKALGAFSLRVRGEGRGGLRVECRIGCLRRQEWRIAVRIRGFHR